MKLVDYGILLVIIATILFVPLDIAQRELNAYSSYEIQYHEKMDNAIDDALFFMVENDDFSQVKWNREECIKGFYQSFYGNFGMTRDPAGQQKIRKHLPLIGVIELNRISIAYQYPSNKDGEVLLEDAWTEYRPYQYEQDGYYYEFFIGNLKDWIKIYFPEQRQWQEGFRLDLAKIDKEVSWIADEEQFDRVRRHTVIQTIKKEMQKVINQYNFIGNQYGYQYEFYLPEIEKQDWCKTVDDMGIIVLFQGYPVDSVLDYTYSRFIYAGARTYKEK